MNKHHRDRVRSQREKHVNDIKFKPQSNRVMCPTAKKMKQLFETEGEAKTFIKFNAENLAYGSDRLRVYWCDSCAGFHISSKEWRKSYEGMTDRLIETARSASKKTFYNLIEAQQIWNAIPTEIRSLEVKEFGQYVRDVLGYNLNSVTYQRGVLRLYREHNNVKR